MKIFVSEYDWSRIRKGDPAVVYTNGSTVTFKGHVQSLSEGVDPITGTLWVNIKTDQPINNKVAAGIFGKAQITPGIVEKGWRIPYDALLESEGNKGFVFTTRDGKTAMKIPVQIGEIEHGYVTITSGLENDTSIIIAGNAYLNDQSVIRIKP